MQIGTTHGAMLHARPDVDRAEQMEYCMRFRTSAHSEKNRTANARQISRKARCLWIVGRLSGRRRPKCHWRRTQMPYKQRHSSEEMCAHDCRQGMKIEECEKIDRAELAIDCRRSADPCADCQIRAQQS